MTNTTNNPTTEANITLRGKTGWGTLANSLRATIGAISTTAQTTGHAYTKTLEIGLDAIPGEAGALIAENARKKGIKGWTASIKSNEATEAAIDSIYYTTQKFIGNEAFANFAEGLGRIGRARLDTAKINGLEIKDIEAALEEGGEEAALTLIASKLEEPTEA